MKIRATFAAAIVAAVAIGDTIAEFSLDGQTTIDVPAGSTTRIEYLSSSSPKTLVKTGGGRLEVAIVGNTNISISVAGGTLASVRPGKLNLPEKDRYLHVDANDADSMTISQSGGTNFIDRVNDADGGPHYLLSDIPKKTKPFLRSNDLNGLTVIDFGGFRDSGIYGNPPKGHYDATASALTNNEMVLVKEVFYIWSDNDGVKDLPLAVLGGENVTFPGPTPVSLQSALYRGKGGGGTDFTFTSVTPPSSTSPKYVIDGVVIPSASGSKSFVPGEGWHTVNIHLDGEWKTTDKCPTIADLTDTYGFCMLGGNGSRYGGCRIAEVLICTNTLTEAQRAYVSAYLENKWFQPKVASIRLEEGATLDMSATAWKVGCLDVFGESRIEGEANLTFGNMRAYTNNCIEVSGVWNVNVSSSGLLPNLSFAGNGGVDVATGEAKGSLVYADGTFEKTGEGLLSIAYLGGNLEKLSVSGGKLVVSALCNPLAEMHFDAANAGCLEVESAEGKKLVSKWTDSANSARAMIPVPGTYSFDSNKQVNRPYLVEDHGCGLPIVDFGSQADCNHADGWGGGLVATHPISSNDASNPGFLQGFVVWEDREDSINLSDVSGCEVAGPPLFGGSEVWQRGEGCNGSGFSLCSGRKSYPVSFYSDMYVDFVKVPNGKTYRIPQGLHLLDLSARSSKGHPISHVGCHLTYSATNGQNVAGVYGGTRMGEFMFFKYHLPDVQRARTAATLGAKWFGRENICAYSDIEVSSGAGLSLPYADVSVANLAVAGEFAARTVSPRVLSFGNGAKIASRLKLGGSGIIELKAHGDAFAELSVDSLELDGKCSVVFEGVELTDIIGKSIRIISTSSIVGSLDSCKMEFAGFPLEVRFLNKLDGLYAEVRGRGFAMTIR